MSQEETEYASCDICELPMKPDANLAGGRDPTAVVEMEGNRVSGGSSIGVVGSKAGRQGWGSGCNEVMIR